MQVPKLSDESLLGDTDTAKLDPEQLDEDGVASCSDPEEDMPSGSGDVRSAGGEEKRVKARGLYKPPTHEELQHLKETQNLFTSNLMRLQVSSLVPRPIAREEGSGRIAILKQVVPTPRSRHGQSDSLVTPDTCRFK